MFTQQGVLQEQFLRGFPLALVCRASGTCPSSEINYEIRNGSRSYEIVGEENKTHDLKGRFTFPIILEIIGNQNFRLEAYISFQ